MLSVGAWTRVVAQSEKILTDFKDVVYRRGKWKVGIAVMCGVYVLRAACDF